MKNCVLYHSIGEKYRSLRRVSAEDSLMMCGIFKQATMGDCEVDGK